MMFCPPGLFSITMGWPSTLDKRSPRRRATLSGPEPGGWDKMNFTGLSGQAL